MMEIGIQLYSYSGTELSFEEKLRHAAQAGYSGVEFAGDYGGMTAPELRSRLLSLGLWTRSAHVGLDRIGPELPFLAELGVRYVICPYCVFPDMDAVCRVAQRLNTLGEYAKQYGIRTGFHNHIDEFYKLDGTYILDHLLALTDPALVSFQLDCGWAACAGVSPEAYLAEHAGRFVSIHIKENLGEGSAVRRAQKGGSLCHLGGQGPLEGGSGCARGGHSPCQCQNGDRKCGLARGRCGGAAAESGYRIHRGARERICGNGQGRLHR